MTHDCECGKCRSACQSKPGWFAHGEAEKAAALLGLPLQEFFDKYCSVDWWAADEEAPETFVLSPAPTHADPGGMYPANPHGTCVFYQDGKCGIHAAKPLECRNMLCTNSEAENKSGKTRARDSWRENQEQITELLGRTPEPDKLGFFESLFQGLL